MKLILDIQGFRGEENQFIFKELSAVSVNCEAFYNFLFKPPDNRVKFAADVQRTNSWLTKNHHGLEYTQGVVLYEELSAVLQQLMSNVHTVYVKGEEKRKEILKILTHPNIINIEELGCPSVKQLCETYCESACLWHKSKSFICATRNVKNILCWYNEHNRPQDMSESNNDDECRSSCWCFCK